MPDLEIVGAATSTAPKRYRASIFPVDDVPSDFAETVLDLEKELDLKIWCLIQQGEDDFDEMGLIL
jgi:hypothetical protein